MTRAEEIRNKIANQFDSKKFIDIIAERVEKSGTSAWIYGYHVGTNFDRQTLSVRDVDVACDFARKEGFHVYDDCNCYGVHAKVFSV